MQLLFSVQMSHLPATSIVTIAPYYLLINNMSFDLCVREVDPHDDDISLAPGACLPFWPRTKEKLVVVEAVSKQLTSPAFPVKKKEQEVTSTETLVLQMTDGVNFYINGN